MGRTSRRGFLKRSMAAAGTGLAVPHFIPSSALGADAVAPSERIVMGGIGMGGQGVRNMRNFITHKDVQFIAVCDVLPDRCAKAKAVVDGEYGNKDCTSYSDFRELLDREDVDAMLIATGDRWHALLSIFAAKAGKDVYCEKPMSMTVAEGRALADTVSRYGIIYQCGTQRRSMGTFAFAVGMARSGRLGRLHTLRSYVRAGQACGVQRPEPIPDGFDYDMWLGPSPYRPYSSSLVANTWKNHFDYSGGMVTDWGAHCNDLAQWAHESDLTGPVEYEGTAEFPKDGFCDVPIHLHVTAKYADGVMLVMHEHKAKPIWPTENQELAVKFEGSEGWVYADDGGNVHAEPESLLANIRFGRGRWTDASNWQGHHRNFLDCVKTRSQPIAPAEIAHRSTTTCHAANICLRLGRPLRWDPKAERFVGDEQANRMLGRAMRSPWRL